MTRRLFTCILVLVAAVLALVLWRRPARPPTRPEQAQAGDRPPGTSAESPDGARRPTPGPPSTAVSPLAMPRQADEEARSLEDYQRFADEANVPIDFQVRVIDQDSNAVSGVVVNPDDPTWAGTAKGRFFVRSRNGQVYGRAQIEVYAIYNVHSAIEIDYAVNPNGSRNLQ